MDIKKLNDLMKLCNRYGVIKIKSTDIEIEFVDLKQNIQKDTRPSPKPSKVEATDVLPQSVEISNEDLLFWSSEPQSEDATASPSLEIKD